jgi:GxxExxY protein
MDLVYGAQTERLISGFFTVQNEVGLGRHEEAYHQAYKIWVSEQALPVSSKPPLPLLVAGREAIVLKPDFLAWNEIMVEMKALPRLLGPSEELQLFDYLRAQGGRLGLLVNMGLDRVHVERRIYDPPETHISADWSHWAAEIAGRDREIGMAIRNALQVVYESHRTGYSLAVTEKLVLTSLAVNGLTVSVRPLATATYHQHVVHESALECFVIEDRFVLTLTAQFDNNEFNTSLGLSYLKTLELPWAVAVNFGRRELQINALRSRGK